LPSPSSRVGLVERSKSGQEGKTMNSEHFRLMQYGATVKILLDEIVRNPQEAMKNAAIVCGLLKSEKEIVKKALQK